MSVRSSFYSTEKTLTNRRGSVSIERRRDITSKIIEGLAIAGM